VSTADLDGHLDSLTEPHRSTLREMRSRILIVVPEAEQGLSYSMPAFRFCGTTIAGLGAFKNHLSYLPHSGSVLSAVAGELVGYSMTQGALHFPIDQPLPHALTRLLIATRMREAGLSG
jgi:uncharacterized protein YdhG (YjbR/CyaY superfamily)